MLVEQVRSLHSYKAISTRRCSKYGWENTATAVVDAQNSGFPDKSFSHVTLNFAMHIIPDPQAVLRDTMRIPKPGGTLAFSVWHKDSQGWGPDLRSCFKALPFDAPMPDRVPMKFQIRSLPHIIPVYTAEDYLESYAMMKSWMVYTYWSEESKEKARGMLDGHILKHLREKYNGQGWDLSSTIVLATCQKPL
ncbi:hypothetical protein GGS23DRAFT_598080 [Durotheca rogersii]|uniref:uncharacterized protein n=1 Tax=Durotheca rogersii TaxID=419775 RepID=UPI002220BC89|nr:uncharacterized protein GGS23DRAFT_598080 [Durotheca rogersii]KAI5862067.1 hypothetical protein GGS23DRAFT_598080 [Durotheca rogersii]